ncbi:hypothetical protein ACFWVU_28345 [Streptomyces sp. NPDC058686]|uniref:hypothetical protein n=1 Tax=Streptomyces sp. NPDC058686 TaxID=3346599 RepID=UPI0036548B4A
MPHPEPDLHIRLDLLHERSSAVTATITGASTHIVRALLAAHGFEPLDDTTMVMARIDREEPHYAQQAERALRAEGIAVDITPELRDEIDTEWMWANYPMPWCSREEIRELSIDAQQIFDAIRYGRLIIHAHAHDGWTTVAVGTYRNGPSIHLHGENHLRTETTQYDNPAKAIAEFDRLYGDAVRPGPAPATTTERHAGGSADCRRKVSIGACGRAFGTPCFHEHVPFRCPMLWPDPAQRDRLVEIRDSLLARIAEAEHEGWFGEVEGLQVSLAGAEDKLAQLDAEQTRRGTAVDLGMPTFAQIAIRTSDVEEPAP